MSTPEPRFNPNSAGTRQATREPGPSAAGAALPLGKKRIRVRFWLAAVVAGAAIWAGIAYGLGFF